jgi:hypothetical protein
MLILTAANSMETSVKPVNLLLIALRSALLSTSNVWAKEEMMLKDLVFLCS